MPSKKLQISPIASKPNRGADTPASSQKAIHLVDWVDRVEISYGEDYDGE